MRAGYLSRCFARLNILKKMHNYVKIIILFWTFDVEKLLKESLELKISFFPQIVTKIFCSRNCYCFCPAVNECRFGDYKWYVSFPNGNKFKGKCKNDF